MRCVWLMYPPKHIRVLQVVLWCDRVCGNSVKKLPIAGWEAQFSQLLQRSCQLWLSGQNDWRGDPMCTTDWAMSKAYRLIGKSSEKPLPLRIVLLTFEVPVLSSSIYISHLIVLYASTLQILCNASTAKDLDTCKIVAHPAWCVSSSVTRLVMDNFHVQSCLSL
jgi:hypothetical protein